MKSAPSKQKAAPTWLKPAIGIVLALCVGAAIGWFGRGHQAASAQTKLLRENSTDNKFINPILLAQVPEDTSTPQFQALKQSVSNYVTAGKANSSIIDASVYFRELNTDKWIGVNADDLYAPASMLKVVSLIGLLKAEEANPTLGNTSVTVSHQSLNTDSNQDYYPPIQTISAGNTYTVDNLASRMAIDSDNNAAFLIDQIVGEDAESGIYAALGIPDPNKTIAIDFMSPKLYSRVFRTLYNGGYLSDPASEQVLDLLSRTTFTQGIVAGVPVGTVVAHKFGERTISITDANNPADNQTTRELSDCGIVYAPNDPYLICIMTKGTAFPALQKAINDISGMAWKAVQQLSVKS